jgi:hypothetical protein
MELGLPWLEGKSQRVRLPLIHIALAIKDGSLQLPIEHIIDQIMIAAGHWFVISTNRLLTVCKLLTFVG